MAGAIEVFLSRDSPAAGLLDVASGVLDADERARADRLRDPTDGRRFAWRRVLRRLALARALQADAAGLAFEVRCPRCGSRAHGKPRVTGDAGVHFSAAQSGDVTVVAVGAQPLGIDVLNPGEAATLPAEVFTEDERRALAADPSGERRARLWTRKEAALKALGLGLAVAPGTVEALHRSCWTDGRFGPVAIPGQAGQSTASWRLGTGVIVALSAARPSPVRFTEVALEMDDGAPRLATRPHTHSQPRAGKFSWRRRAG